jgi:hypothetical protein
MGLAWRPMIKMETGPALFTAGRTGTGMGTPGLPRMSGLFRP